MCRVLALLAVLALAVVVVIGLTQAGGEESAPAAPERFDLEAALQSLRGAPAPLAALHEDANELLASGFDQRMEALEGRPAVINKWASWCGPCRSEFPIFQQVATERGAEVAFLGVNAADERSAAEEFLQQRPLPYPSYEDPDEEISRALKVGGYFPMTVFVDRRGRTAYTKAGEYRSAADLQADIDRYLGA